MNKSNKMIKNIFLIFICTFTLISCSNSEEANKPLLNKNSPIENIFFSEMYVGENVNDAILEIGTSSISSVDLRGYKVNFYDRKNLTYSYQFNNETINKSNLIVFANLDASYDDDSSIIIDLPNNYIAGMYYVELVDTDGLIIDSLGTKGFDITYLDSGSLVRLNEANISTHGFDKLNFIKVHDSKKKYLGNLDAPLTKEEILNGPSLDIKRYQKNEFAKGDTPLGGYAEVSVSSLGDGDTTYFNYPDCGLVKGRYSTRYLMIDTPEISHGPNSKIQEEPWGQKAKKFNNDKLKNASSILIQSNLGSSLKETYNRLLGYVWYTNDPNKSITSYRLLNFELVKEGLAEFSLHERYDTMKSNDVSYFDYLDYVNEIARRNKIKIHGEIDPNFNYE